MGLGKRKGKRVSKGGGPFGGFVRAEPLQKCGGFGVKGI